MDNNILNLKKVVGFQIKIQLTVQYSKNGIKKYPLKDKNFV